MANNLSNKTTRKRIAKVFERYQCPIFDKDLQTIGNWRAAVAKKTQNADIETMRKTVLPSVQYNVIELAHEAKNDSTKLRAAQLVLEQAGQGAMQRVDHHAQYSQLPVEQLQIVIKAKLAQLQQLIPGFTLEKLIIEKSNPTTLEAETGRPEDMRPALDMDTLITQCRIASKSA